MLEAAHVPRPRWTAQQLLSHRLSCQPIELYLKPPSLSPDQLVHFHADVAARASGVPLQYLMKSASFYGREFSVGPGVFIPRPETEILIDVVLDVIASDQRERSNLEIASASPRNDELIVVDVGTGSGAIAITLKLENPHFRIFGVDTSTSALSFARRNADRHRANVAFLRGNLLDSFRPESVDLMVANLPYLDPEEAPRWPKELHWEPWMALDGGERGFFLMEQLIRQAALALRPEGRLVLEEGAGQTQGIRSFASSHGLEVEGIVCDLAGLERVLVLQPPWKD